jgi:CTP synthase
MKYIFVTGGVVSSLGKGITAASLGRLLVERGFKVNVQKLDPYLNVDPGTMNPAEHGEVFVTDDGLETDLDIGHYERFIGRDFNRNCNYTSGKIYSDLIEKEREGKFLGATIQIVPHVTNEIKSAIKSLDDGNTDIGIIEVGGTVGDMEGMPFLEAIRQLNHDLPEHSCCHIHVSLLPYLESAGEVKTKPTQHSVKELSGLGLFPNIIVCRSNNNVTLTKDLKAKMAMFCNLKSEDYIIHNKDCKSLYEVPIMLHEQNLDGIVLDILHLKSKKIDLSKWKSMLDKMYNLKYKTKIAIVGKYVKVPDAYISITESLKHAGFECNSSVDIKTISAEDVEKYGAEKVLKDFDGVVVPGGFGNRGIEGKILTAKYCRENNVPYLGICLGLQTAVIEFARNVCNIKNATSTEFTPSTKYPIIDEMLEQKKITAKGGTMRLGAYDCEIKPGTLVSKLYGKTKISERHRHRFEFNNKYKDVLGSKGLVFSGMNPQRNLVEIIENPICKFFVACQFHPEFKSRPYGPHPLFIGLIKASLINK